MKSYSIYLLPLHVELPLGSGDLLLLALQVFLYPRQQLVIVALQLNILFWGC